MTKAAIGAIKGRLVPGARYMRAGIILNGISRRGATMPLSMFEADYDRRDLGPTLDAITKRHGTGTIGFGLGGIRTRAGMADEARPALATGNNALERTRDGAR